MKGLFLLALLATAAGAAVYYSSDSLREQFLPSKAITANTVVTNEVLTVSGIGYVEPVSEVRKLSFKIDGVIASCPVTLGQFVKKEDILLELANLDEQAEVEVAENQLALAVVEREKLLI